MARIKKNISTLSIKRRSTGKCALERQKEKENNRLIIGLAHLYMSSRGVVRRNALLAIYLTMQSNLLIKIDFFPLFHPPIQRYNYTINTYPGNTWIDLRFRKQHLSQLCLAFGMLNHVRLNNGCVVHQEEAFLIILSRMATLKTLIEQENFWGREYTVLSRLISHLIDLFDDNFGFLLTDNLDYFQSRFQYYNEKIVSRIVPPVPPGVQNVCSFTDATVFQICRPSGNNNLQVAVYNGKDRVHALKLQSTGAPDGMCMYMPNPFAGRRQDK